MLFPRSEKGLLGRLTAAAPAEPRLKLNMLIVKHFHFWCQGDSPLRIAKPCSDWRNFRDRPPTSLTFVKTKGLHHLQCVPVPSRSCQRFINRSRFREPGDRQDSGWLDGARKSRDTGTPRSEFSIFGVGAMGAWMINGGFALFFLLASTGLFFFVVTRGALLVRGLSSGSHTEKSHVYPIYSNMRLIKLGDF